MAQPSPEPLAALANLVVALADNKYFLGRRLSEWAVGAPALEAAVACAAIAQEELGHTRGLYSLLESLPAGERPRPLERDGDRERKYCLSYLLEPTGSWYDAVAILLLADTALTTLLEAARESSFDGLRRRAVRILDDEPFHRKYAKGRVRELAETPERELLRRRVDALLPETLCWFGPAGEPGVEALREAGILDRANEELRRAFLDAVAEVTGDAGLGPPAERAADGSWDYGELPWDRWSSLERRLEATATTAAASA